jgi:hypothetical protein
LEAHRVTTQRAIIGALRTSDPRTYFFFTTKSGFDVC